MRRWMAGPLLFAMALAFSFITPSPTSAQDKDKANPPDEETFLTADGIQLHGLFHKSEKSPGSDPVVILLYPPGKDNSTLKGDWGGLANKLTKAGYNVFRFDWRGHGKSFDIKDTNKFWTNPVTGPWNRTFIKGSNARPVKDTFFYKDLLRPEGYMPVYLTDLAAARAHLDSKNDAGEVNSGSIYLIGAETTAAIGTGWLAAEWNRPSFYPGPNQLLAAPRYEYVPQLLNGGIDTPGGNDIGGCIWLSPQTSASIGPNAVKSFITGYLASGGRLPMAPKTRDNNPMLFLYAPDDSKGKAGAKFFHVEALVGNGNAGSQVRPLNAKFLMPVEKGGKLSGVHLLGNDDQLGVESNILKFLDAQQAQRKGVVRKNRNYNNPYYIKLDSFGFFNPQG